MGISPLPIFTTEKCYTPYYSPFDPCPPIQLKCYSTPPSLYIEFQPPNLEQSSLSEALSTGTLWPAFDSNNGTN
ncbi:spore coat associated protein CotJA [Cytobacillus sp. FJAT-54145]|uniref:Spore coat associated protein CotJA n=1 Tax=Cytobacillus spartinae TaxID=3299023 RepID=A0ABW6KGT9_9BACI